MFDIFVNQLGSVFAALSSRERKVIFGSFVCEINVSELHQIIASLDVHLWKEAFQSETFLYWLNLLNN